MFSVNIDTSEFATPEQLERIRQKEDWRQEFHDIGLILIRSLDKNFMSGGRPRRWTPSRRAIAENGMTLVDTGRLRRSTNIGANDNIFINTPKNMFFSTDVPYYKYLAERYPLFIVQEEDIRTIKGYIQERLMNL
jgi:phage gpG-like protein